MKTCSKCEIEKELVEFFKDNSKKDGFRGRCKSCEKDKKKLYHQVNKEKIKDKKKLYHQVNKEKIKEKNKAYHEANRDEIKEKKKAYYEVKKEQINKRKKAYYEANKEKNKVWSKIYYENNKEQINKRKKAYDKNRLQIDPLYKMTKNIRTLIGNSFKNGGWKKNTKTQQILGCDFATLEAHLNDNLYGFIHEEGIYDIDHIIPLATATSEEDIYRLNHYTNLQLLPSAYNRHIKIDNEWDREDFEKWFKINS